MNCRSLQARRIRPSKKPSASHKRQRGPCAGFPPAMCVKQKFQIPSAEKSCFLITVRRDKEMFLCGPSHFLNLVHHTSQTKQRTERTRVCLNISFAFIVSIQVRIHLNCLLPISHSLLIRFRLPVPQTCKIGWLLLFTIAPL